MADRTVTVDARAESPTTTYEVLKTVVAPRPIAWISSVDGEGHDNLAPYSFFNCVSKRVIMFASGTDEHGRPKDTARNAVETGEFVVNLATPDCLSAVDETSAPLSSGQSEFDEAGVEHHPSIVVDPPGVAASPVNIECTLYDSMPVESAVMVLGRVEYVHVDEALVADGRVDARLVETVGRLGGPYYTDVDPLDQTRAYPDE